MAASPASDYDKGRYYGVGGGGSGTSWWDAARARHEIFADPSGGWRYDWFTGSYDNIFSGESQAAQGFNGSSIPGSVTYTRTYISKNLADAYREMGYSVAWKGKVYGENVTAFINPNNFNFINPGWAAVIYGDNNYYVTIEWGVTIGSIYNQRFAGAVEGLAGKPYILGEDGPEAYDCSGAACYGIRTVANSEFSDYTAHDLFSKFSITTNRRIRGSVIFYDYTSNGRIDHITTILNSSEMLHPSSGAGVLQIKPIDYLDSYTIDRGGVIYYREFHWSLISQ